MLKKMILPAILSVLLLSSVMLLSACGSDESSTSSIDKQSKSSESQSSSSVAVNSGSSTVVSNDSGASSASPLLSSTLKDVDGNEFKLGDYKGKPVFVEMFATWCSNCQKQLPDTQKAAEEIGDNGAVVALSVETNLSAESVRSFRDKYKLNNVRVAIIDGKYLAQLVKDLGNTSVNPPSVPHFVVNAAGEIGKLNTGFESSQEIKAAMGL